MAGATVQPVIQLAMLPKPVAQSLLTFPSSEANEEPYKVLLQITFEASPLNPSRGLLVAHSFPPSYFLARCGQRSHTQQLSLNYGWSLAQCALSL